MIDVLTHPNGKPPKPFGNEKLRKNNQIIIVFFCIFGIF